MNNNKNNKDLNPVYEEASLNDQILSSWENNRTDHMIPPHILGRYYKFLRYFNLLLVVFLIAMVLVIVSLSVKFIFFHQHELLIFSDGTDISCVYNPQNGEISQNDK